MGRRRPLRDKCHLEVMDDPVHHGRVGEEGIVVFFHTGSTSALFPNRQALVNFLKYTGFRRSARDDLKATLFL